MKMLKRIDQALFGWGSPVTFGVVRIVTAGLVLINLLMVAIDFDAWFTERGFIPLWHATKWGMLDKEPWWQGEIPRLNVLSSVTDERVTLAIYALCCLASLLTMIGLWTRISSIVLFVLLVSIHHRAPDILHSGDTLLRQMVFLVMIAPSGAACSLDRLIALAKSKVAAVPNLVSLWPQRLMQFQVSVVYFTTVWHKLTGTHWRDGTATWFVPQLHEFDRFPVPPLFDQQPFVAITTYGTLIVELSVAILVYARPLRKWVLLAGLALHAGIEYHFNIPLFSFIMCSTYLAFYDGDEYSAFAKRLGQKWKKLKLSVSLPEGATLSGRYGTVLTSLDFLSLIDFRSGISPKLTASNRRGEVNNPYIEILKRCPAAWVYFIAPGAWRKLVDGVLSFESEPVPAPQDLQAVNS